MDSDYWCHRCEVAMMPLGSGDEIKCPHCNGGFVEQIQGSPRRQRSASPFADPSRLVALISSSPGSGRRGREEDQESGAGRPRVLVVGRPPVIELLQALGSAMAGLEISGDADGEGREEGSGGGGSGSSGVVVVDPSGMPLMLLHSAFTSFLRVPCQAALLFIGFLSFFFSFPQVLLRSEQNFDSLYCPCEILLCCM